jgi:hypothetical protein
MYEKLQTTAALLPFTTALESSASLFMAIQAAVAASFLSDKGTALFLFPSRDIHGLADEAFCFQVLSRCCTNSLDDLVYL